MHCTLTCDLILYTIYLGLGRVTRQPVLLKISCWAYLNDQEQSRDNSRGRDKAKNTATPKQQAAAHQCPSNMQNLQNPDAKQLNCVNSYRILYRKHLLSPRCRPQIFRGARGGREAGFEPSRRDPVWILLLICSYFYQNPFLIATSYSGTLQLSQQNIWNSAQFCTTSAKTLHYEKTIKAENENHNMCETRKFL